MRRVVITGIGLITPVGNDRDSTWSALLAGKSGAAPITQFDASAYATKFACEVKGYDASPYFEKRDLKHYDRFLQLGVGAALMAMEDAGYANRRVPEGEEDEWGVYIGAGLGGLRTLEDTRATASRRTSCPT
jgi:3-oxoacyl-[acyl-carrier-protein] synthase II